MEWCNASWFVSLYYSDWRENGTATCLEVAQRCKQGEHAPQHICPPNNTSHSFTVDRMHCKQECSKRTDGQLPSKQVQTKYKKEHSRQCVQGHVDQVIPVGVQLSEEVVDPKGGGANRSEGLVAPRVSERSAPEIVGEEGGPRSSGAEVSIGQYGSPVHERDGYS